MGQIYNSSAIGVNAADGNGDGIFIPALNTPGATGQFFVFMAATGQDPGTTYAASELYYTGINDEGNLMQSGGHPPGGTWELRGYVPVIPAGVNQAHSCVICIRIDGTNLMPVSSISIMRASSRVVSNCRFSSQDNSTIDCEILLNGRTYPFTACEQDSTAWGQEIYHRAIAGEYGNVLPYVA